MTGQLSQYPPWLVVLCLAIVGLALLYLVVKLAQFLIKALIICALIGLVAYAVVLALRSIS